MIDASKCAWYYNESTKFAGSYNKSIRDSKYDWTYKGFKILAWKLIHLKISYTL